MINVYFASPLFTTGDQDFNRKLTGRIREAVADLGVSPESWSMYVPQENEAINDKNAHASPLDIYLADTENVYASDLLVANLDGVSIDPGVALEIGLTKGRGIPTIALCTDIRMQGYNNPNKLEDLSNKGHTPFFYYNQMVIGAVEDLGVVTTSEDEFVEVVAKEISLMVSEED